MAGMLWAALGGASKAGMQVMDDRVKAQADDRKRLQSITDRREDLLYEMDVKLKMAEAQSDRNAKDNERANDRGSEIANERGAMELERGRGMLPSSGEFASDRITPKMIAELPSEARAIYEREMGMTDDSSLQMAKDRMQGGREIGASGDVRKELATDYNDELKIEKARRDQAAKDRREEDRYKNQAELEALKQEGYNSRQQAGFAQQASMIGQQISAADRRAERRGSGGGSDDKTSDRQAKVIAERIKGIDAQIKAETDGKRPSQIDQAKLTSLEQQRAGWADKQRAMDGQLFPGPKPVAQQSTKTDNGATKPSSALPQKNDVVDGWVFLGGNPKDQKNWKKQ